MSTSETPDIIPEEPPSPKTASAQSNSIIVVQLVKRLEILFQQLQRAMEGNGNESPLKNLLEKKT